MVTDKPIYLTLLFTGLSFHTLSMCQVQYEGMGQCGWAASESTPFTSTEKTNGGGRFPEDSKIFLYPLAQLLAPASGCDRALMTELITAPSGT